MENPILARLERLGAKPSPLWLWTLLVLQEGERYPLPVWNEALSRAVGRKVFCPSYRALERRLEEALHSCD